MIVREGVCRSHQTAPVNHFEIDAFPFDRSLVNPVNAPWPDAGFGVVYYTPLFHAVFC